MRKLFFVFCLLAASSFSFGQLQTDTGRIAINAMCDKFMKTFSEGKYSEAVQLLKISSTMGIPFIDDLDKTVNEQMRNIQLNYRKLVGYTLIEEKELKNVLARRRYLLKFELYFLTFDFYLYNNGTNWTISGFYYKDDQKDLF